MFNPNPPNPQPLNPSSAQPSTHTDVSQFDCYLFDVHPGRSALRCVVRQQGATAPSAGFRAATASGTKIEINVLFLWWIPRIGEAGISCFLFGLVALAIC